MKQVTSSVLLIIILVVSSGYYSFSQDKTDNNTRSVRDSVGFCWNANEMNHFIEFLSQQNPNVENEDKNLIAAISVHDDYLYAGNVYFPLYKNIKAKEIIIFGVTHGTVRKELGQQSNILILDNFSKWKGPYKDVEISPLREVIKSKLPKEDFIVSNKAHSIEHSIEALIPFLQYYNRDIKITPIMVTQMPYERMNKISDKLAEIVSDYAKSNNLEPGKDIFFLISNDANHYGEDFNNSSYGLDSVAHKIATDNDKEIIQRDLVGELTTEKIFNIKKDLWPDSTKTNIPLWCGRYPIVFGLQTVKKVVSKFSDDKIHGKLYRYSDTFTEKVLPIKNTSMGLTAIFSYKHWCGWFTEGFYLKH